MRARFERLVITTGLFAAGWPVGAGCDRTISEKETVTHKRDGTVVRDRETVKEKPDGSVVIEKDKDVAR